MSTAGHRGTRRLRLVDDPLSGRQPTGRAREGGGATVTPLPVAVSETPAPSNEAAWVARTRPTPAGGLAALPDAQLVALGSKGDVQALEALYRRHAAFAIHLATRIEGSARDVEDVVHDGFLRAFERLGDLADRGAFRAWLGAIVVHAVRSRMRRARLMNLLGIGRSSEPVDLDALASPDASPHVRAQIAQVYALLRTQPTDDRIAWTLRAVEGHDLETVARLTRCSLATVKRRISRAQKFLDEHFVAAERREQLEDENSTAGRDASSRPSISSETKSAVAASNPSLGLRDAASAPSAPSPASVGSREAVGSSPTATLPQQKEDGS